MIGNDHVRFGRGPLGAGPAQAGTSPDGPTSRRLKTHGLIARIEQTHRYRVTDNGLHTAAFLTRIHDRLLPTGLADLADPHTNRPLRAAAIAYQKAIDNLATTTGIAA